MFKEEYSGLTESQHAIKQCVEHVLGQKVTVVSGYKADGQKELVLFVA